MTGISAGHESKVTYKMYLTAKSHRTVATVGTEVSGKLTKSRTTLQMGEYKVWERK